jgi:hypothetical protein
LIKEHGIVDWAYHPYTDVWQIMEKFNIACLNLAAGYYRYHTDNEYVVVDDVQNGFELGLKLVEELGENKYENPKEDRYSNSSNLSTYWKGGSSYTPAQKPTKTLLVEDEENEDDFFNSGEYVCTDRKREKDYGYYSRSWNEWDEDYDW